MTKYQKDFTERVIRGFLVGALTAVIAGLTTVNDMDSARALAWAAGTAGVSAVLSLIAKGFGSPDSASFLDGENNG